MTALESPDTGSDLLTGRALFGVTGRFEYGPLRDALRQSGLSMWPALLLGLGGALLPVHLLAALVLRGRVESALGPVGAGSLPTVAILALAASCIPALRLQQRWASRVPMVVGSSALASAGFALAGVAGGRWTLTASAVLAGIAGALGAATQWPLLTDIFRPEVRVRAFGLYGAAFAVAVGGAVAVVSVSARGTTAWRSSYLVLAVASLVVTGLLTRLRDVPRARWDGERLAAVVEARLGGLGTSRAQLHDAEVAISEVEKLRRVLAVPSAKPVLLLAQLTGLAWLALPSYSTELLRSRFDVVLGNGHTLMAATWAAALVLIAWWARRGEVQFRYRPELLLASTSWAGTLVAVGLATVSVAPSSALVVVGLAVVHAGLVVVLVGTAACLLAVVPPRLRPQASVLLALSSVIGAVGMQELMGMFGSRFGVRWGLLVAALAALVSNAVRPALTTVSADLDAVIQQLHESTEVRVAVSQGQHLPLLSCRKLDFSYGQLQVLFGVDFTVDDGEMVALLGTNGAGKSTLLRAVSGLGAVDRGTIHYRGSDITYLGTDRRVELGITQIPGGRAVFGPMTVADNLRVYGYTCGRDRRRVEAGIESAFAAFPRLAERRNQPAVTLSGGEQQMLGLAKALILGPRLLLIDELSLGLAPVVVGDLLEMVRKINAEGTAVVLVEQSVNIALSLVDHAYFMEKGEMRFDGPAADLLARPDLLRSVFLEGASKGMS